MRLPFGRSRSTAPDDAAPGQLAVREGGSEVETVKGSRAMGWGRLLQGNRIIWIVAGVAILSLIAGLVVGRFVVSPSQVAADTKAPDAGLITVPIENRVLANDVTLRGDANYADSVAVTVETGDLGGPAIVTGRVPEVGSQFKRGSVALEVTGRPVIVLPGDLPVYRTMRVGVSGPDVLQLKEALKSVGIDAGDEKSSQFDSATSRAIDALYAKVGYPAPESPEGSEDGVRAAADGVRAAEDNLSAARRALDDAEAGPNAADRLAQDNLVRQAERELAAAQALVDDPTLSPSKADQVAAAKDALALAKANRAQALEVGDLSAEKSAVRSARDQLDSAHELLDDARTGTLTYLPSSEVLFLPGLPRRVDEVTVQRGTPISGPVMQVSGATLQITASAAETDARLLEVGEKAILAMPDDTEHGATITSVQPAKAESGSTEGERWEVLLEPDELTSDQLSMLQGNNVRVSIPVSSTDGEVLAVPLAALTAGAGGESRIEIASADGETTLVEVTTGLAAEGFVEITAVDGSFAAGDLVVVGR